MAIVALSKGDPCPASVSCSSLCFFRVFFGACSINPFRNMDGDDSSSITSGSWYENKHSGSQEIFTVAGLGLDANVVIGGIHSMAQFGSAVGQISNPDGTYWTDVVDSITPNPPMPTDIPFYLKHISSPDGQFYYAVGEPPVSGVDWGLAGSSDNLGFGYRMDSGGKRNHAENGHWRGVSLIGQPPAFERVVASRLTICVSIRKGHSLALKRGRICFGIG